MRRSIFCLMMPGLLGVTPLSVAGPPEEQAANRASGVPVAAESRPTVARLYQERVAGQGAADSGCNGGFFMISTVHCPQAANQGWRGEFQIERGCLCGRFHRASLESLLQTLRPGVPVCIGVHGSFVREGEVRSLIRSRYHRMMSVSGNRPFHFISFHWPSDIGFPFCPASQTRRLGQRAGFNGVYLAQLIGTIPATNPVCLAGHSHGTRVISSALHLLAGGMVDGHCVPDTCPQRPIRVVFSASAIDSHWLSPGEKYGLAMNRVERLLNLRTRHDFALTTYPLQDPLLHSALGKTGFQSWQLNRMGLNQNKIREFDVTQYVGLSHEVSAYFPHDVIWQAMTPYLLFD